MRVGLAYVKGVGQRGGRTVEEARNRGSPFQSLRDFCERTGRWREATENLIEVGAFDNFGLNWRELLWQLGLVYRPWGAQLALPMPTAQDQIPLPDLTRWERLVADYGTLGFSTHDHPLAVIRPLLGEGVAASLHLDGMGDGLDVEVAGLVVCRQQPATAGGFIFLVLEDEFGLANVVVNPAVYRRYRALVRAEPFLVVSGRLQCRDGTTKVIARSFRPLRIPPELVAPPTHNFG